MRFCVQLYCFVGRVASRGRSKGTKQKKKKNNSGKGLVYFARLQLYEQKMREKEIERKKRKKIGYTDVPSCHWFACHFMTPSPSRSSLPLVNYFFTSLVGALLAAAPHKVFFFFPQFYLFFFYLSLFLFLFVTAESGNILIYFFFFLEKKKKRVISCARAFFPPSRAISSGGLSSLFLLPTNKSCIYPYLF